MSTQAMSRSSDRRALWLLVVLALVAAAGFAGWWAARSTLTPQVRASESAVAPVWAEATQASVGRSLPLSTTLRQPARTVAANTLPGVVTQVSAGEVDVGDAVYVVGDAPVRVVAGERPFYRELAKGAKGWDVKQLQTTLAGLGHLEGKVDGDFGPATEKAVKKWQKDQGRKESGVVPLGELIAVPDLPTVVQLGETIVTGSTLGGGEEAVLAPTGERQFVLVVTSEQARIIPAEATVQVTYEDRTWPAVIAGSSQDEYGSTEYELTAPDGGVVCGKECGMLPGDANVTLRSAVIVVPQVEGTGVPASAVHTRADGTAYVISDDGEIEVTVAGSGQGIAIVEGVEVGTRVQVLDGDPGAPPAGDGAGTTDGG